MKFQFSNLTPGTKAYAVLIAFVGFCATNQAVHDAVVGFISAHPVIAPAAAVLATIGHLLFVPKTVTPAAGTPAASAGAQGSGAASQSSTKGTSMRTSVLKPIVLGALCALLISIPITQTACDTSWVQDAEAIVQVAVPAASGLVQFVAALNGSTITASDAATINSAAQQVASDFNLVGSLVTQVQGETAAAQPGTLATINSTLATLSSNLNALLPALHITDPATTTEITAAVSLLTGEVSSISSLIAQANSSGPSTAALAPIVKAPGFKANWNATLSKPTGNPAVDAAAANLRLL